MKITIPFQPIGWKAPQRGRGRRMFTPPDYAAWRDAADLIIRNEMRGRVVKTPAIMRVEYWTDGSKSSDPTNILKACEDAMVRCKVIKDDNHHHLPEASRKWRGVDKTNPRAEITIETIGE